MKFPALLNRRPQLLLTKILLGTLLLLGMNQFLYAQVITAVGGPSQVTTSPTSQIDPSISGEFVVYTSLLNGDADVYAVDLVSAIEFAVATGPDMQQLQDVSGTLIVYTDQSIATGASSIMAYDITSSTSVVIADGIGTGSNYSSPSIDGTRVAYQYFGSSYDIHVSDILTGSQTVIASTADQETNPTISGNRVVFERQTISGWDVVMHDLSTGVDTVIAAALLLRPFPDINGDIVAWVEGVAGNSDIHTYNVATGKRQQLALTGDQGRPRVSGGIIAFDDIAGPDLDVVLWQLHGDITSPVLYRISGAAGSSEFLNDIGGNRIAYTSDVSGNFDIWVVEFSVDNPPVAEAGPNQSVAVGSTVTLDGTGSYDDVTPSENLVYEWSFGFTPNDANVTLIGADTATPQVTVNDPGDYELILVVKDEVGLSSQPDMMVISTVNVPPNANAGPDQGVVVNELVTLDGSGSNDPDGDPITYTWSITGQPPGSLAALTGANSVSPTFTPDLAGAYTVQLIVSDGTDDSTPDDVIISVITAEVIAETNIKDALNTIAALPRSDVSTRGNQQALIQSLLKALDSLQNDDINEARKKLQQAIERTDGCALRGAPDAGGGGGGNPPARDYITDCAVQNVVYPLLVDALNSLVP